MCWCCVVLFRSEESFLIWLCGARWDLKSMDPSVWYCACIYSWYGCVCVDLFRESVHICWWFKKVTESPKDSQKSDHFSTITIFICQNCVFMIILGNIFRRESFVYRLYSRSVFFRETLGSRLASPVMGSHGWPWVSRSLLNWFGDCGALSLFLFACSLVQLAWSIWVFPIWVMAMILILHPQFAILFCGGSPLIWVLLILLAEGARTATKAGARPPEGPRQSWPRRRRGPIREGRELAASRFPGQERRWAGGHERRRASVRRIRRAGPARGPVPLRHPSAAGPDAGARRRVSRRLSGPRRVIITLHDHHLALLLLQRFAAFPCSPLGPFVPAPPEVAMRMLREQGGAPPPPFDGNGGPRGRKRPGPPMPGPAQLLGMPPPPFRQDPRRLRRYNHLISTSQLRFSTGISWTGRMKLSLFLLASAASYQDLDAPEDEVTVIDYRSL